MNAAKLSKDVLLGMASIVGSDLPPPSRRRPHAGAGGGGQIFNAGQICCGLRSAVAHAKTIDVTPRRRLRKTADPSPMYITDLTHFLDKSGAIGPVKGPARAMAQFHVDVVAHGSDATSSASSARRVRSRLSRPRTAPWCGSARCAALRGGFRTGRAASGICATARRPSADRKSEADGPVIEVVSALG